MNVGELLKNNNFYLLKHFFTIIQLYSFYFIINLLISLKCAITFLVPLIFPLIEGGVMFV
jgi:DNA phosphorothioation-dependent restriction protein DptG